MNGATVVDDPVAGVRAGETDARAPSATVLSRVARALTPNLRQDPRAELRDMRVKEPLRTLLQERARGEGVTLDDDSADDPYADASGNVLKRQFSVLRSVAEQVVLLQIPDWIANDGGSIGALNEIRDAFTNRKVRIVAEHVPTPAISLTKKMPQIWRERASIDLEFVSWRFVEELLEGKHTFALVFGVDAGSAPPANPPAPAVRKAIKTVFIGSTGLDLHAYREVARDVCLSLQLMPIMMEHFEAMGLGATAGSKKKLDTADLYVGIYAHRYGYIEQGYAKSVTEIEFEHAEARRIERLCFVVDPTYSWPPDSWDAEHHAQMEDFRKRIDKLIRARFTSVDDFRARLMQALIPHVGTAPMPAADPKPIDAAAQPAARPELPVAPPEQKVPRMLITKIPDERRDLQKIAGGADVAFDIIFVHGLGGDSWTTWMADRDDIGTFWPNWLAEEFPSAGLWTLGYAANGSKWKEESMPLSDRGNQILDQLANEGIGERPLAFVTHSMGGIVAKQILRHAESFGVKRWEVLTQQTKGIAFIATPHSGAHIASFAEFASAVYRTNEHVKELAAHDPRLRELHGWFLNYQSKHQLVCRTYCEKREVRPEIPWLGVKLPAGVLVVDETSAEPNILGERAIPLDEDHVSICKPASRTAQVYRGIVRFLKDCEKQSRQGT